MIYEVRTYDIKPKSQAEVEKRFGEAYEHRKKLSPLAAFWHTEIGSLNQIIHVWGYKDMEERHRIRSEAVKSGGWPPKPRTSASAQTLASWLAMWPAWGGVVALASPMTCTRGAAVLA